MPRPLVALLALIVGAAAALAWAPLPPAVVERYYADWFYPAFQGQVTSWSNTTAFSLFDVLLAMLAVLLLTAWVRWIRAAWRRRTARPVLRGAGVTLAAAAAMYLWFAGAWGLNYAREPLETVIGYDAARVTPAAVRALAERSVRELNRTYAAAHAEGFPAVDAVPPALVTGLHEIERRMGRTRPTVPGRPKRTLLAPFFRASGVDGMHAPFLLETLLNPDLTPPERPAVLAHEWAHMSGYAPEDDASVVGVLAAFRADAPSRYSAWHTVFDHTVAQVPRDDQRRLLAALDPGPRADRQAVLARLQSRVELVAEVSWLTYDQYLKSQGVREGVQSYSRVVQLLVGAEIEWP